MPPADLQRSGVPRRLTRQQSVARTRQRLLRAARDVFLERGFYGTSLEAVAEAAGFSKGAVYSRFVSKADLFLALLRELNQERVEAIRQRMRVARSIGELETSLKSWWSERISNDPAFQAALVEYWSWAARDETVRKHVAQEHAQMLSEVAGVVDETAARLGVKLPYRSIDLVLVLSGLARALSLERQLNPEIIDDRLVAWAMDLLVPGQAGALTTNG